jgi:hypothetical protein
MRIFSQTAARHTSSSVLYFQLPCNPLHVATCVMRWCGTVRNTSGGRLLQIRELGGPRCRVNAHRTCWRYSTAQGAPEVARRGEPLFADLVVPFSDCPGIWSGGEVRSARGAHPGAHPPHLSTAAASRPSRDPALYAGSAVPGQSDSQSQSTTAGVTRWETAMNISCLTSTLPDDGPVGFLDWR